MASDPGPMNWMGPEIQSKQIINHKAWWYKVHVLQGLKRIKTPIKMAK